jgi:hypothetical protein
MDTSGVSYRGDMCRELSCTLQQEAHRFLDAGMPEWSHRFARDAELLRMRADREDELEAANSTSAATEAEAQA